MRCTDECGQRETVLPWHEGFGHFEGREYAGAVPRQAGPLDSPVEPLGRREEP